jgi:hypothetical protein
MYYINVVIEYSDANDINNECFSSEDTNEDTSENTSDPSGTRRIDRI